MGMEGAAVALEALVLEGAAVAATEAWRGGRYHRVGVTERPLMSRIVA